MESDNPTTSLENELQALRIQNKKLQLQNGNLNLEVARRKNVEKEFLASLNFLKNIEKIDNTVRESIDPEETIENLMQTVRTIFKCERTLLLFPCSLENETFSIAYRADNSQQGTKREPSAETRSMTEAAKKVFGAVLSNATPTVSYINPGEYPFDAASHMMVGLKPDTGESWLLAVQQRSFERSWSTEEIHLFEEISYRVTNALNSLLYYRSLKESKEILQKKSIQLETVNRDLEARVQEEIGKRHKKEQMLIQQSKMAAMGEMIGAIAHQWRQPLTTLSITLQDIKDAYDFNELDEIYLSKSVYHGMKQINFMSKTIDDFRNFFAPDKQKSPFSFYDAISNVISMVQAELSHHHIHVTVQKEKDTDNTTILGYENEFKQVVINLVNNAKDAICEAQERGGIEKGYIVIDLKRSDDACSIIIEDNAGGIPTPILNRIFEPYFTTKEQGKGTGIGLYMSKLIIEDNMNGLLEAKNCAHGAQFRIVLPISIKE